MTSAVSAAGFKILAPVWHGDSLFSSEAFAGGEGFSIELFKLSINNIVNTNMFSENLSPGVKQSDSG